MKNLYSIINGSVLELTQAPKRLHETPEPNRSGVYIENHNNGKLIKVVVTIDARGDEIFNNQERVKVMKDIITEETITNIPKMNSTYKMYMDSTVEDENGKQVTCNITSTDCEFTDEVTLLPIEEDDSLPYVHNMAFESLFRVQIPTVNGFGITKPKYGKERIFKLSNITIFGDSAPESEAGRYDYYHKPDAVKKYKDAPSHKCPPKSPIVRHHDMLFLDPYHRLPSHLCCHYASCVERTVSERALELKEKYSKLPSINENIDMSHITFFDAISDGVEIDLSGIPTTGVKEIEIRVRVIMDAGIEVSSREVIEKMLADNYDILYPPVIPEETPEVTPDPDEPTDGEDDNTDVDNGEILPTPGVGGNEGTDSGETENPDDTENPEDNTGDVTPEDGTSEPEGDDNTTPETGAEEPEVTEPVIPNE